MAFNLTRAKLAEFTDTRAFEDMCSSLLVSDYPHIIPLGGTKDRGRDAIEPTFISGLFQSDDGAILQFSTEKSWESKLKRELKKVFQKGHNPIQYVFVTSQKVSSTDFDRLRQFANEKYSLPLLIYDVEWLRVRLENPDYLQIRHHYLGLDEDSLAGFLEIDEYAERRIDRDFAPDLEIFLGRNKEVEQIESFQKSTNKVLVVSGLPGLGKTKVLIEAAKKIKETGTTQVMFIRPEVESLEAHFKELDPKYTYLLVLDDAHDFRSLRQLLSLLMSPEFKDKLHVLAATHPWAKDELKRKFERSGHPCEELDLKPLTNQEIGQIVKAPALGISEGKAIDAIVTVSEGNPLIAVTAATFWKEKGNLAGLTKYQLLSAYFARVLEKAISDRQEQANLLLAIIAATRGLNPTDPNIRTSLAQTVQVSEGELDALIDRVRSVGLLKRTWREVRIAPDLFAEHVMFEAFFSDGHRYDFTEKVIKPFFEHNGDKIFKSLAIAEALGGKGAKAVLDQELADVRSLVKDMNNAQRVAVLNWLKKFAFLRPEDSLLILRSMLESLSYDPAEVMSKHWGRMEFTINDVFRGASEILRETWLYSESCLRDTLAFLYLIAEKQDHSRMNQDPWGDSLRVLTEEVITIQPGKNIRVQEVTLEEIEKWVQASPSQVQQDIIARCLSVLLSVTWGETQTSAIEPNKFTISRGLLAVNKNLRSIRQRALQLYKTLYSHSQPNIRLNIIDYLGSEFGPYLEGTPEKEMNEMLTEEAHEIFSEFERVSNPEAVQEKYAIWKILKRLYDFHYITSLPDFFNRLYTDEVEMYAHLTAWPGRLRDIEIGYREAEKQHNEYWQGVVSRFAASNLETLLSQIDHLLECVSTEAANAISINVNIIASLIKDKAPKGLAESVGLMPDKYAHLKEFASSFLGALYTADCKLASSIADDWIQRGDITVQREVCKALLWLGHDEFQEAELEQIDKLASLRDPIIDSLLTWPGNHLKRLELHFPDKAVEILKDIARRCSDTNLQNVAELLEEHEGYDSLFIVKINANDLKELAFNFVRLENLDMVYLYHVEGMLKRLFMSDFNGWIEFWEARINHEREYSGKGRYLAVPFDISRESDYVASSGHRVEALETFLEWSAKDEWAYRHNGAQLFKLYSGGDSSHTQDILDNWLESGDVIKLRAVARVLKEMGYSQYFLEMAKKLVDRTDDELVLSYLGSAVGSTGVVSGSLKTVWQARIVDFEKWLADPDISVRANVFAKRLIDSLRSNVEIDEEDDRED